MDFYPCLVIKLTAVVMAMSLRFRKALVYKSILLVTIAVVSAY